MNVNTENEHILVCLSSSPSNKNIIFTASKMANALQAQFTALYVQTGARIQSEDKERLDENIRFAVDRIPQTFSKFSRFFSVSIQ